MALNMNPQEPRAGDRHCLAPWRVKLYSPMPGADLKVEEA